jgi:hypothetical protein
MKNNEIVLFTHIYRTGGMATFEYLQEAIGPTRCKRLHLESLVPSNSSWPGVDVIISHFPYGTHKIIPGRTPRYVTFLREPSDRILSHWFSGQNPRNTFEAFVKNAREGRLATIDNMMTRVIAGQPKEVIQKGHNAAMLDWKVTWDDLERAKYNLENYYTFVGCTDMWLESVQWLCKFFDWPAPTENKRGNASKYRPRNRRLPPDVMETIYRRDVFDAELYRFGRALALDFMEE